MRSLLSRVPWIVWALLAPAVILAVYGLIVGDGRRIPIVGAGAVATMTEADAPEGIRYALDVRSGERPDDTRRRIEAAITEWPDILIFGFDESALDDVDAAKRAYEELTEAVENAAGVPVVVGLGTSDPARADQAALFRTWFREELCSEGRYRVCVEPGDDVAGAVAAAARDGIARHDALRATTQVGR